MGLLGALSERSTSMVVILSEIIDANLEMNPSLLPLKEGRIHISKNQILYEKV
jgi:hypothetical protein